MPTEVTIAKLGLLVGLSFFLGLAFEGFYLNSRASRPGGIRTFPLLALVGGFLYAIEPHFAVAFAVGLLVVGLWLYPYYRTEVELHKTDEPPVDGIMVPVCNLVAYVLGPVTLTQSSWVAISLTVLAVLLLRARERLHRLALRMPGHEVFTLVQFLILTGIMLPLLPHEPVSALTPLTPFEAGLAVVVVCSISYASYLLQRYVSPTGSLFFAAVLGGMYSSTATTVVLARRMKRADGEMARLRSGIVLATAVMYIRIGVIVAIFNQPLALALAPWLAGLAALGGVIAVILLWPASKGEGKQEPVTPRNPLEIGAAIIFAVLFVAVSVMTAWLKQHFGSVGVYGEAGVVGVTDIDPFVLSLAHGGSEGLTLAMAQIAILIAASSNNVLKACYTVGFGGWRGGRVPLLGLTILALAGLGAAGYLAGLFT